MSRKLTKPELLAQFFSDNPDEELTASDVAVKLNCSIKAAYVTIHRASKIAHLEHVNIIRVSDEGKRKLAAGAP